MSTNADEFTSEKTGFRGLDIFPARGGDDEVFAFLFELLQLGEMAVELAGVGADELIAFAELGGGGGVSTGMWDEDVAAIGRLGE